MPNLFEKAVAWLPEMVDKAAGITLTLTRAAESTPEVPAVIGQVSFRSEATGGVRVQLGDRDYIIEAADYLIGGVAAVPSIGDRYQETGSADVYELQDPGTGEKAWRWSNPERTTYRLHVKKVRVQT